MAYITIRQIGPSEDTVVVVLWFSVVGVMLSPVLWAASGQAWTQPTAAPEWLGLLGVGTFAFFGQLLLNRGIQTAPAGPATAMRYGDVVVTFAWGLITNPQQPNAWKWVGALMVMSTMAATLYRTRLKAKKDAAAAAAAAAAVTASTNASMAAVDDAATALPQNGRPAAGDPLPATPAPGAFALELAALQGGVRIPSGDGATGDAPPPAASKGDTAQVAEDPPAAPSVQGGGAVKEWDAVAVLKA
jgi:drug/metabolite transporter superfamily protein YnfA